MGCQYRWSGRPHMKDAKWQEDRVPLGSCGCMRSCDDSDWIVTMSYPGYDAVFNDNVQPDDMVEYARVRNGRPPHAVYGITRGDDVQHISLWMD